ncbi:MAG: hypothetical protein EA417_07130 [Gammaproteobacteria bacterium]|nr:MAG: hypothetical protein EA417_07130 [Gammaproteobacteria bacterium]
MPRTLALPLLILCTVIYFIGPNLGAPQWGSLMGDLVRESRRDLPCSALWCLDSTTTAPATIQLRNILFFRANRKFRQ